MSITRRLVGSIGSRLNHAAKLDLVEASQWYLQDAAYFRLRERGFNPGAIIDIGAFDGRWSEAVRATFRDSPILMIEARSAEEPNLKSVCASLKNAQYAICLLGRDQQQSVPFTVTEGGTGSSIFSERSDAARSTQNLPMRTLDDVASFFLGTGNNLFIKIDVQGAELEVLQGGRSALAKATVVQLELPLLAYNEGAPEALDVMSFMDREGFALFDIAGFIRPNGRDLVQIDALFVRKTSTLRTSHFIFP